jgi:hypothetical protein
MIWLPCKYWSFEFNDLRKYKIKLVATTLRLRNLDLIATALLPIRSQTILYFSEITYVVCTTSKQSAERQNYHFFHDYIM